MSEPIPGRLAVGDVGRAIPADDRPVLIARTDFVNQQIEQIEELIRHLARRLEPVIGQASDREAKASLMAGIKLEPGSAPEPSWLAQYLEETAARLGRLVSDLRLLADRVDL